MYACPQGLAPRTLIAEYKGGLKKNGIKPPKAEAKPVEPAREYRRVPEERLMARLGLTKYDKEAPLDDTVVPMQSVKVLLSQHIGAPAVPVVKAGDLVTEGQMIAEPAKGLSVGIHASISGRVQTVTDTWIGIVKE